MCVQITQLQAMLSTYWTVQIYLVPTNSNDALIDA